MKIGLTATVIQGGKSGVAQYVFSLVRELIQLPTIDLTVFALEDEMPLFGFAKDSCRLIPVPRCAAPPVKNILWHQWELPKLAASHRLDLIHVPSYRRLVFHGPCPTVGTIHDLAPFHVRGKYDLARMMYGRVVVKQLARHQKELIAVSHTTAKDIEHFFGIPSSRVRVIHNGIDHERFHPGRGDEALEWMAKTHQVEAPFFLYVSRLEHPAKNHVRLIAAFDEFKRVTGSDWQLVLGGGEWHGSASIYRAASASAFEKDIHFLGFVPDADLPNLYRAAKAMVYPSLFEGFGLPPVEAMACGTPVISSIRGALEEVVADSALTIDPEDIHDIAHALSTLSTEESLANRLIVKGLANANRFHWSRTATAVVDTYRDATN
jgi:glycosyltransferase involved in cell wall biosynthesis